MFTAPGVGEVRRIPAALVGASGGSRWSTRAAFAQLFKGSAVNPAYGLSWWLPAATNQPDVVTARLDLASTSDLPDLVIAAGAGNQRRYVSASCGVTIVRQATFDPATAMRSRGQADAWSDYAFLKPLLDAFCG